VCIFLDDLVVLNLCKICYLGNFAEIRSRTIEKYTSKFAKSYLRCCSNSTFF